MMSGNRSSTSMGGGLASRFSLALSRVIDNTAPTTDGQSPGNVLENHDDDDMQEVFQLIEELNKHSDLTVKLSNQSKICSIFTKNLKNQSLTKRKFDQNLKDLDPQIKHILDKCRQDLEELQEQKE